MAKKQPKKIRPARPGQTPLMVFFPNALFASMRARFGKRGAAPAIRKLVAEHLAK